MKSPRSLARLLACLAIPAAIALFANGCASSGSSNEGSGGNSMATGGTTSKGTPAGNADLAALEQKFVIGPAAARDINYRVAWQYVGAGPGIRKLVVQGDSAFVLDKNNVLTRIKTAGGERLWRAQVGDAIDLVLGIILMDGKVFVTTDIAVLVLDGNTGSQIGRQKFERIANTASAPFNQFLLYGSRNGQVIWHLSTIGQQLRAYQVAHSIQITPLVVGNDVVAVGNDGNVMVINAATGQQRWSKKLLAPVVALPAADSAMLYLASTDQYLYGFDLTTGRSMWKVLTERPLTEGPILKGDRVYQQIPGHGLSCFNAQPLDSPGGELFWNASDVTGSVIMQRHENTMAWDAAGKKLTILETSHGSVVKSLTFPQVKHLVVAGDQDADIYAASDDGNVVKLVPRN